MGMLTYALFVPFRLWLMIYSGGLFTLTYRKQVLFIYSHRDPQLLYKAFLINSHFQEIGPQRPKCYLYFWQPVY